MRDKIIPAVIAAIVAGAIAVVSSWRILRSTQEFQRQLAKEAQEFQEKQARSAFQFQKEQAESTQEFQKAQADQARIFQKEQTEKAVVVERHAQAYTRWRQLLFFEKKSSGDGWTKFMNDMEDWSAANKLYLTSGAAKAFAEAVRSRFAMDTHGDHPAVDHLRREAFQRLDKAGDEILANSPRYGSAEMPEKAKT